MQKKKKEFRNHINLTLEKSGEHKKERKSEQGKS